MEAERLRTEKLLREEELQGLEAEFHRVLNASEEAYLAAMDEIIRKNALLQRVLQALEAEIDLLSGRPVLMQLLCSLRAEVGSGLEATSTGDTPPNS
ncbi:hypothetical protein V5799_003882 [Amblyomma americanum]|uniref:Uncharacterized protein n=1 Tax=Amblyomma americanum TaxID=6943 RepID=A0AAQ4D7P7_AMBAM